MIRLDLRLSARPLLLIGGSLFLGLLGTGCRDLPHRQGAMVDVVVQGSGLEELNPIDVAVPPVLNETGNRSVPLQTLRTGFQDALVKRRYSPLALEYVDSQVVEAAYVPGALSEEAVLLVTVREWDDHLWDTHGTLFIDVEARMIDPKRPGEILWGGRLQRRYETKADLGPGPDAVRQRRAATSIAAEILAAMPARQPSP